MSMYGHAVKPITATTTKTTIIYFIIIKYK